MTQRVISVTKLVPGVVAAAYSSGDAIGTLITFANVFEKVRASGIIRSIGLVDQASQNVAVDLVLFDANPSATTITDNAALDIADADLAKILGSISIVAGDYAAFADNSFATKLTALGVQMIAENRDLYGVLVSRGAPTYANAADLTLRLSIERDA